MVVGVFNTLDEAFFARMLPSNVKVAVIGADEKLFDKE